MSRQHYTFTKLHRYSTERDASIPYDTIPIRDSTQRLGTVRHPTDTVPNATLQSQDMTAPHMTGLYPHTTTPCLTVTPRNLTQLHVACTQLGHTLHYITETEHHRTILDRAVTILGWIELCYALTERSNMMSNYTCTTQCHTKARGAVPIHNVTTPYYTSTTRDRAKPC